MIMNYEILPGPSLAELARTTLARAAAATVSEAGPANARQDVAGRVPVRTRPDGSPLLLAATGSMLEQRLTTCPDAVTVSVPAAVPFSSLRLTGTARAVARDTAARITACAVAHPRGLDRHGLELLVLTPDGTVAVRLSLPDGPVSSLEEVPASIRTVLTCRCRSGPGHEYRRRQSRRAAGE